MRAVSFATDFAIRCSICKKPLAEKSSNGEYEVFIPYKCSCGNAYVYTSKNKAHFEFVERETSKGWVDYSFVADAPEHCGGCGEKE